MKYLAFFFVLPLLFSCQEDNPEVIDINDIIAQSENYNEDSVKITIKEDETYVPKLDLPKLEDNEIGLIGITASDTILFPDRYEPESKELFHYSTGKDTMLYVEYSFKSNEYANTVFQNWINCFGSNCKIIPYGTEERIAPLPFLLLQTEKQIIYIYNCPNSEQEKWIGYYINEKSTGKLIQQFTKYKSGWSTIEEGKILPIKITKNESL